MQHQNSIKLVGVLLRDATTQHIGPQQHPLTKLRIRTQLNWGQKPYVDDHTVNCWHQLSAMAKDLQEGDLVEVYGFVHYSTLKGADKMEVTLTQVNAVSVRKV